MNIYQEHSAIEPFLNHILLVIDMPKDAKLHTLYTQAWTNMTLLLLQCPKNIQNIINALIYNHVSHCLSNQKILFTDKTIKPPSHKARSRILLTDYNFTTNITYSHIITTLFDFQGTHPCVHDHCFPYEQHSFSR